MSGECELPEFYSITEPKAAKTHRCCECRAPILSGEKYVNCVGAWLGDGFKAYKQHALCAETCEFIRDHIQHGDCIAFGDLKEFYRDDGRHMDKKREEVQEWRGMMAAILRRERSRA